MLALDLVEMTPACRSSAASTLSCFCLAIEGGRSLRSVRWSRSLALDDDDCLSPLAVPFADALADLPDSVGRLNAGTL